MLCDLRMQWNLNNSNTKTLNAKKTQNGKLILQTANEVFVTKRNYSVRPGTRSASSSSFMAVRCTASIHSAPFGPWPHLL